MIFYDILIEIYAVQPVFMGRERKTFKDGKKIFKKTKKIVAKLKF